MAKNGPVPIELKSLSSDIKRRLASGKSKPCAGFDKKLPEMGEEPPVAVEVSPGSS